MMKGRLALFLTFVVVVVALVALNAASYVRVEEEGETEFKPDRSTYNAGPTGTRAFFEYLQRSGHEVSRWNRPPAELFTAAAPATLIIVGDARRAIEDDDAQNLLTWVEWGGRLVIIDRSPSPQLLPTSGRWRVGSEVVNVPTLGTRPDDVDAMTRNARPVSPVQPTLLTRDVAEVRPSRFAGRLHIYQVGPPSPVTARGVGPGAPVIGPIAPGAEQSPPVVQATPEESSKESNADEDAASVEDEEATNSEDEAPPPTPEATPAEGVVAADEESEPSTPAPVRHLPDGREGDGALLVDYAHGEGRVIVLSDPYIVSNAGLKLADNLLLAANVAASGGGPIAFDEYHQGYGASPNRMLAYFAGTPILWMFAQGALIVLAVVWTRGRRFARPLPAPRADRRSKLEFVASMAELQQRARAYDLALENIYARVRRALARYGGARADAPASELASRVAARSRHDRAAIEKLLRECEDAIAGEPVGARRALSLARDLRRLERELGLLMRSREIRQAETL